MSKISQPERDKLFKKGKISLQQNNLKYQSVPKSKYNVEDAFSKILKKNLFWNGWIDL